ncbi:MAG: SpoIIIAH-like family protein [Clostridiales bacterium]|nr:SpoIIIAH-like family protein [Clostridiales bacterium]
MMETKKMPPKGQMNHENHKGRGRAWLRAALLLLLVGACSYMIWQQGTQDVQPPSTQLQTPQDTAVPAPESARTLRETAYDKDINTLTELTQNEQTDEQTRNQAAQRITQMVSDHQSEIGIEEALAQAGFSPLMVLLQNGALTVMVTPDSLAETQSATILSICAAHTDIGIDNIRIMTGQDAL